MEMVEREVEGEPPLLRSLTFRKEHPGEMVCWFNLKTYKVYKVESRAIPLLDLWREVAQDWALSLTLPKGDNALVKGSRSNQ
jgi:hypothetical protein